MIMFKNCKNLQATAPCARRSCTDGTRPSISCAMASRGAPRSRSSWTNRTCRLWVDARRTLVVGWGPQWRRSGWGGDHARRSMFRRFVLRRRRRMVLFFESGESNDRWAGGLFFESGESNAGGGRQVCSSRAGKATNHGLFPPPSRCGDVVLTSSVLRPHAGDGGVAAV